MKKLKIDLPEKQYDILIEKGLRRQFGSEIKKLYTNKKIFIITDQNVYNIYGEEFEKNLKSNGFEPYFTVVEPGEKSKSISVLESVYDSLLDKEITRSDMIVALGGGVVGDLTGFVAATLLRGIRFIQIPTSLLAQIDSSVGGKVAVNLEKGKNLVGNFYHPDAVLIDPEMLLTLEKRYFYDGMAEVIKYGCIKSEELFRMLESYVTEEEFFEHIDDIIYRCCDIKRAVVEEDEKDTGNRMLLNFGHTLGHAVEKCFGYEKYTHGEGVAIGMYNITLKSEAKGETEAGVAESIKSLLVKYKLPYEMPEMDEEEVKKAIGLDKKSSSGSITLILVKRIGESYLKKIAKEEIVDYI